MDVDITVTFENNETVSVGEASLGGANVAVLSHVRRCHLLVETGEGTRELWESALESEGNAALALCRDPAWLVRNARATDALIILADSPDPGEGKAFPCFTERLLVPAGLQAAQVEALAGWVRTMAAVLLERLGLRRLVDRFEVRMSRESDRARMADLLQEANQRLQEQFVRDALTGIPNRRRFDEQIDYLWGRAVGEGGSMAAVMIDIDNFKKLNDSLGHQAGDECLRKVAQRLYALVEGEEDLLARYGGEEFVALLWDAGPEDACRIAEALRRGVEELGLSNPGNPGGLVTVSLGVNVERPGLTSSAQEFLHRADQALYRSKGEGRNRWTLHEGAGSQGG